MTARTIALNRLAGAAEAVWEPSGGGLVDPTDVTRVEQFVTAKAALRPLP